MRKRPANIAGLQDPIFWVWVEQGHKDCKTTGVFHRRNSAKKLVFRNLGFGDIVYPNNRRGSGQQCFPHTDIIKGTA